MEDEINLRKYINVLLRNWKLIVSITLIAVVVAGLVSFFSPRTYQAKAIALVTAATPEIILEPAYKTESELEGVSSLLKTLVPLATSATVATMVSEQLGDKLAPAERRPGSILNKVTVTSQGNLIEISVESADPQSGVLIANTWVESYVSYANGLYSGVFPTATELESQADATTKEYEKAQKMLEAFLSDNRIDKLNQQIADTELLCNIRSLREQIEAGSLSSASAAANSLALVLLQVQAFTSIPAELHLSLEQLSGANASLDDIDTLISTLEARLEGTKGQSISELQQNINKLKAELEQEQARQRELKNARDIAWQACTTVASKAAEVKIAAMAQSNLVQVAEVAVAPESPVSTHRTMTVGIALVLGLVAGVFAAFGVEYFKKNGEKAEVEKKEE